MLATLSSITAATLSTMTHNNATSNARPARVSDSKMISCSRWRRSFIAG